MLNIIKETLQMGVIGSQTVLYDTYGIKSTQINRLALGIEFLEILLACGIA